MESISLEDSYGLQFWPPHKIASLRPDFGGRIQAVHADGSVAHRPGPLPNDGPWRKSGDALVLPSLLSNGTDPAGFSYTQIPPLEDPLPEEQPLPILNRKPSEILYLRGADNRALWFCDNGVQIEAGPSAEAASVLHPHLVPAGRGTYVNRRRLRALCAEHKQFRLILDEGTELTLSWGAREPLQEGLGLTDLYHLYPYTDALLRENLRDWPAELATTKAEKLRQEFPRTQARRLIANLLWQTVRYRQQGLQPDYGIEHRGYWYVPLVATLARAGMLSPEAVSLAMEPIPRGPAEGLYALYLEVIGRLVGDDALFTFTDLGFRDPRPDLRRIGLARPDVVLIAEKTSLEKGVQEIAARYGVSTIILGGLPSLLSSEFFARELRKTYAGPVHPISYVDFDPGGWIAAHSFQTQLARFGVPSTGLDHLVTPQRFTADELDLYSIALPTPTPEVAGKVKAWLELSGGVNGEARGIHADHLRPVERAADAFGQVLNANLA